MFEATKQKPLTAQQILDGKFKGQPNFITPTKVKVGKIAKNTAFELSSGRGFSENTIFGISVIHFDGERFKTVGLSGCRNTEERALFYIQQIKSYVKDKMKAGFSEENALEQAKLALEN